MRIRLPAPMEPLLEAPYGHTDAAAWGRDADHDLGQPGLGEREPAVEAAPREPEPLADGVDGDVRIGGIGARTLGPDDLHGPQRADTRDTTTIRPLTGARRSTTVDGTTVECYICYLSAARSTEGWSEPGESERE